MVVVGRRTKEGKEERREGGMEEWKEIGFCTTTTYYCYYYIGTVADTTVYLLLTTTTCTLLIRDTRIFALDIKWDMGYI